MIISNTVRRLILINGNTLHGTAPPFSLSSTWITKAWFFNCTRKCEPKGNYTHLPLFPRFLVFKTDCMEIFEREKPQNTLGQLLSQLNSPQQLNFRLDWNKLFHLFCVRYDKCVQQKFREMIAKRDNRCYLFLTSLYDGGSCFLKG